MQSRSRRQKSENSRYILFRVNGNLWRYDQHDKKATCACLPFADGSNDDVRADYGKHNVKVLWQLSDEGDVDFLGIWLYEPGNL